MIAVLSLLLVATLFISAARVATIALVGTGMATDVASFQARSALMGVGYTTTEAEDVINHPVRRRIILWLMTFGNAGIITGVTSMLLGFVNAEASQTLRRAAILAVGLVVLIILTRVRFLERLLTKFTRWALARWTTLETRDLANLLRFGKNFGIIELAARDDDWLVGRPLESRTCTTHRRLRRWALAVRPRAVPPVSAVWLHRPCLRDAHATPPWASLGPIRSGSRSSRRQRRTRGRRLARRLAG